MKQLAEIATELTENPEGLGKSLTQYTPKVLDATAKTTLKHCLSQSFDLFNTYGKDPEALQSIYRAFEAELGGHDENEIRYAFRLWLRNQSVMPTVADILKILKEDRPERTNGPHNAVYVHSDPRPKTREEIENVRKIVAEIEEKYKALNPKTERRGTDYAHWERLSDDQRNDVYAELQRLRMKRGEVRGGENVC